MKRGLAGLTVRGRALLAAGVTAVCCAVVLGQPSLVRVGVLIAVLPLLAAWWVGRLRPDLEVRRRAAPPMLTVGQRAEVRLEFHHRGRRPLRCTRWTDHVGYALGDRPRLQVGAIEPGGSRTVSYPLTVHTRGRHPLGPATLRLRDPFGLVEVGQSYGPEGVLYATPRVVDLPAVEFHLPGTGRGSAHAFAAHSAGGDDVLLHEYQHGDDLRRVHWPTSARTGRLVVRREEQTLRRTATVLLDNRVGARGHDSPAGFEAAVTSAASIAVHLIQAGVAVRLVAADGTTHAGLPQGRNGGRSRPVRPLVEWLAEIGPSRVARWDLEAVRPGGAPGTYGAGDSRSPRTAGRNAAGLGDLGLVIGLFGRLVPEDGDLVELVDLLGSAPASAWALLHHAGAPAPGTDLFTAAGWRVSTLGPGDALADVWREAWRHPAPRGVR